MAMAERAATVIWEGGLARGGGSVTAGSSGAFTDLETTWASRTERAGGRTSPEELIAAAHASCFSMALSGELEQDGHPPDELEVEAVVTLDEVDGAPTVTSSRLRVSGRVEGMDEETFRAKAEGAKEGCPVSRALQGNVEITLDAGLR